MSRIVGVDCLRLTKSAFIVVLLLCLLPRLRHPLPPIEFKDFSVYYAGAVLVHQHESNQLYTGADNGKDPQTKFAEPDTPIARVAREKGISGMRLYVYPPVLADLLLPLSGLTYHRAFVAWLVVLALSILGTVGCLLALFSLRLFSLPSLLVLIGVLVFIPINFALMWGQITLVLLFLWTLGLLLYSREKRGWSAAAFALAAAIKLTPLIVLLPFLIWREWRWLRVYLVSLVAVAVAVFLINSPSTVIHYFGHVVPSMSGGIPVFGNFDITAATQLVYASVLGDVTYPYPSAPHPVAMLLGKALSLLLLVVAMVLVAGTGRKMSLHNRVIVVGLLGLLSPLISPVSWTHAYATAFLPIALLWGEALRRKFSAAYVLLLSAASVAVGNYLPSRVMTALAETNHHALLASSLLCFGLLLPIALILWRIALMRGEEAMA